MVKRKPWISGVCGMLLAAVLCALVWGTPAAVNAATTGELRDQIGALETQQEELEGQVAELESQLADNLTEMEDVIAQKQLLDQQVSLLYDQVENINEQITAYDVLIADKQDELDEAQAYYDELKTAYKDRIRAMEEDSGLTYWSVLFKSQSFADFLDRMNMIEEIAASDQRRLDELQEAAVAVADAQTTLEEEKTSLEATKAELGSTEAELTAKQENADALLEELRAKGDEYLLHLEEAELAQSALMQELAAKNTELDDLIYQEWLATYVPPTTTAPPQSSGGSSGSTESGGTEGGGTQSGGSTESGGSSGGEGWLTPVSGYYISSPFGPRINPFSGQEQWHEGIDMVCAGGTPIYATRSGVVTSASYNDSCGYYVYIGHDGGYGSIYMHMTHYIVGYGDYVSQGQVIGYVGSTGESEVEHLHFGISYNGSYVNPLNYI